MIYHDMPYLEALKYIMDFGEVKSNRTGINTKDVFGLNMDFDLSEGFPLLTTKRIHWKSVIVELLWFLRGETNVKWLQDRGVTIWDEWADENGELGPVYGSQWRNWNGQGIDQLQQVIDTLRINPNDRRMIVTAWNPGDIDKMALPPCHMFYQFNVREGKYLDCQMYQRSCDFFLGVPFNIASYSALVHIIARMVDLLPGYFQWVGGSCHIYENHFDQVGLQLDRVPRPSPTLKVTGPFQLELEPEHFELIGYNPYPGIKADVAV